MADKITTQKPKLPFYLVTRPDGQTCNDMWVQFWRGVGLFGLEIMHFERPDWVKRTPPATTIGFEQVDGVPIEDYLEYFGTRGWKVEETDTAGAKAFRAKVAKEKRDEEIAELAKVKARQKAKTAGKEVIEPIVTEDAVAGHRAAAIAEGIAKGAEAPASSSPADLPPHESGAMQTSAKTGEGAGEEIVQKPMTADAPAAEKK